MRGPESPATPTTEAGLLSFQLLPRSDSLPWAVLLFCGRLVSGNAADRRLLEPQTGPGVGARVGERPFSTRCVSSCLKNAVGLQDQRLRKPSESNRLRM